MPGSHWQVVATSHLARCWFVLPLSPQDHDVVSLCSEVAGWTDDLMARPKAKAKGKAIASPASAGGNRIALALRVNAPPSHAVAPPPPSPHVASLRASPSNAMAVAAAAPVRIQCQCCACASRIQCYATSGGSYDDATPSTFASAAYSGPALG